MTAIVFPRPDERTWTDKRLDDIADQLTRFMHARVHRREPAPGWVSYVVTAPRDLVEIAAERWLAAHFEYRVET